VLHRGEVRERGRHAELLARDGLYRRLYELQVREAAGTSSAPARVSAPGEPPPPAAV